MQEKIVEIILSLISDMRSQKIVEDSVIKKLVDKGYTQPEISAAVSWIYDKVQLAENIIIENEQSQTDKSYRFFHESEKMVFTPEARGYLMQCYELGLIDEWDLEYIIDRVMLMGFPKIDLKDVKPLVISSVFDYDDSDKIGSRIMLSAKDTIH